MDLRLSALGVAALAIAGLGAVQGNQTTAIAETTSSPVFSTPSPAPHPAETALRREPILSRSTNRTEADASISVRAQAERRAAVLQTFAKQAKQRSGDLRAEAWANRWVLPVSSYRLTGRFGDSSYLWSTVHTGLDFAAPEGTSLMAVAAGVVVSAGYDGSYGNRTVIELSDGTELWYCHQSSIIVSVGEQIAPGQQIGAIGSTGNVTGPHLHLEVRPGGGDPVDPSTALAAHGLAP